MTDVCTHVLGEAENGQRLDVIAAEAAGITRSRAGALIKDGLVLVNGVPQSKAGLKLKEMPITFAERRAGSSKISGSIATETLKMVFRLRFGK